MSATGDGHDELQDFIKTARDAHQQAAVGPETSDVHEQVLNALRNLAWRVLQLERDLEVAQATIDRLEGKSK